MSPFGLTFSQMILHTETSKLMYNWSFLFEVLHKPTLLPSTFNSRKPVIFSGCEAQSCRLLVLKKKKKKKKALVERKGKHPTFVLASYGAECYRNSCRNVKANTRHLF